MQLSDPGGVAYEDADGSKWYPAVNDVTGEAQLTDPGGAAYEDADGSQCLLPCLAGNAEWDRLCPSEVGAAAMSARGLRCCSRAWLGRRLVCCVRFARRRCGAGPAHAVVVDWSAFARLVRGPCCCFPGLCRLLWESGVGLGSLSAPVVHGPLGLGFIASIGRPGRWRQGDDNSATNDPPMEGQIWRPVSIHDVENSNVATSKEAASAAGRWRQGEDNSGTNDAPMEGQIWRPASINDVESSNLAKNKEAAGAAGYTVATQDPERMKYLWVEYLNEEHQKPMY
eukprot:gene689-2121_t